MIFDVLLIDAYLFMQTANFDVTKIGLKFWLQVENKVIFR